MENAAFRVRVKSAVYAASLLLMLFFTWACRLAGDSNLPPQKPLARLIINAIFALVLLFYFLLIREKELVIPPIWWLIFFLVGVCLCTMPPVFSGDLHEYLMRGRILGVYHENPYLPPRAHPEDLYYGLTVWVRLHKLPENYGPAWAVIQWIMPTIFGANYFAGIFSFKLLLLGFMVGSAVLFFQIARKICPGRENAMTALFALNPNLIDHFLVDGHNDIVMVFGMLLAFYWLLNGRSVFSVAGVTLSVLVKFTAGVMLPVIAILRFKRSPGSIREIVIFSLKALGVFAGISLVFYLPFWTGWGTLKYFRTFHEWFATNSIPYAVWEVLGKIGWPVPEERLKLFFVFLFAVNFITGLTWLFLRKEDFFRGAARTVSWIFVSMYISYTIPFYGHHLSWAFPFMILSEFPAVKLWVMLYTSAGMFFYFKRLSFLFLISAAAYSAFVLWRRVQANGEATL